MFLDAFWDSRLPGLSNSAGSVMNCMSQLRISSRLCCQSSKEPTQPWHCLWCHWQFLCHGRLSNGHNSSPITNFLGIYIRYVLLSSTVPFRSIRQAMLRVTRLPKFSFQHPGLTEMTVKYIHFFWALWGFFAIFLYFFRPFFGGNA